MDSKQKIRGSTPLFFVISFQSTARFYPLTMLLLWVKKLTPLLSFWLTHILHLYAKKLRRIEIRDKYYTKSIIF